MIFNSDKPIYIQISNRICEEILIGKYPEQERLPSARDYVAIVEVNINTIVRAFDYMQTRGIIFNKRGIGYFVSEGARKIIFEMKKEVFVKSDLKYIFSQMDLLGMNLSDIEQFYSDYKSSQDGINK